MSAAPVTQEEVAVVIIDGCRYDAETGEFLGPVDEKFRVDSIQAAEWVLQRMLEAEAAALAVEQTDAVIQARAIIANAEQLKAQHMRRAEGLRYRFEAELAEFARQQLAGQKSRTWKTLYGSVALRRVAGGLRVEDPEAAVAWAKKELPAAVKVVESFQISAVSPETKAALADAVQAGEDDALCSAFRVEPEREAVKIETGVSV
jgi:hypothetical protein